MVFISHMHADHHFSLLSLLEIRKKLMAAKQSRLILFSPAEEMKSWLYFYDKSCDNIRNDIRIIDNAKFV